MSTVIIRTFAYNAEKTIERSIKSILNQTHTDFIWYLVDNGSTDRTGKIIEQYANNDQRIVVIKNEKNHIDTEFSIGVFYDILNKHDDDCYFCTLDSDDCYSPFFFEEMLEFIDKNHLDIAACASVFQEEDTEKTLGIRSIGKELIIEEASKAALFTQYHPFMRTIWGKLYSFSLLRKCQFDKIKEISYGNDTYFATEAFSKALRIGLSDKVYHKYYVHKRSISSILCDEKRLASPNILLEQGIAYLSKYGEISLSNIKFLIYVYYHSTKDTIMVVFNTKQSAKEKLNICHALVTAKYAKKVFQQIDKKEIKTLQDSFKNWLFSNSEEFIFKNYKSVFDILQALCIEEDLASWKCNDSSERFLFYLRCLENSDTEEEKEFIQTRTQQLLSQHNFHFSLSKEMLEHCKEIIVLFLNNHHEELLQCFFEILKKRKFSSSEEKEFIHFGQYLAALVENQDSYIFLKKYMIAFLLEENSISEALIELDDYDVLLPHDQDFLEFRKILNEL